jgi:hypothetical protein
VRPADIQRVARRVIRRERLNVAVVGSMSASLTKKVSKIVNDFR